MLSCAFWLSFTALPAVFPGTHLRHVCSRVSPVRHLAMSGFPRTLRADFWQVPEGSVPASSNGVNYSDFSAGQLSTARILQQSLDLNPRDSGCPLFLLFIYSYFLPEAHCDFNPLLIIFFFFFLFVHAVWHCGLYFPDQELNLDPLQCKQLNSTATVGVSLVLHFALAEASFESCVHMMKFHIKQRVPS